MYTST